MKSALRNFEGQINIKTIMYSKQECANASVFIVEDNEVYARTLKFFIQTRFPEVHRIKIFTLGEMFLMKVHYDPTIVIVDYFLNSRYEEARNGFEIIKRIKAQKIQTSIIVMSAQKSTNIILEAIKKYAFRYVQKDEMAFYKVEMIIREILNRKTMSLQNLVQKVYF